MIEKVGIIGWENIEPVVLSALVAKHPILFVSSHGCNKTDGARILSKVVLGPGSHYQHYDTHLLKEEEFLGWPDVRSLKKGVVGRIHTPESIWNADSVLFDELNRVNPFVAAKTMEVVRSRRVMGEKLKLQYVFASVNPPQKYESAYMDVALVSRFCVVPVPGSSHLAKHGHLEKILALPSDPDDRYTEDDAEAIRKVIRLAQEMSFNDDDVKRIYSIVTTIVSELGAQNSPVDVSPRQARDMARLLLSLQALGSVSGGLVKADEVSRAQIVMSLIPEAWPICRDTANRAMTETSVQRTLAGLRVGDPMLASRSLLDLVAVKSPDKIVWAHQVKTAVSSEDDPVLLREFILKLVKRAKEKKGVDRDLFNSITSDAVARLFCLSHPDIVSDGVSLSFDRQELVDFIRNGLVKKGGKGSAAA